jgi:hypothetical protein
MLSTPRPIVLLLILIFLSCKKENENPPDNTGPANVTYPDYTVMKPGNYWIYQLFQVNEDGTELALNTFDSAYVEKDTTIEDNSYHKYVVNGQSSFVRDSLSYLVRWGAAAHVILFSSTDFNNTLRAYYHIDQQTGIPDTFSYNIFKMTDSNMLVTTPAGQFRTCNFQERLYLYPNHRYQNDSLKYYDTRYAQHIGKVSETVYFSIYPPAVIVERRLIRYHLE